LPGFTDGAFSFSRVAGGRDGVLDRVVGIAVGGDATGQLHLAARIAIEELVAHAHRRGQAGAGAEPAAGLVDGGGGERQPDAMDVLVDERARWRRSTSVR
jgi:hypothetical protein